MVTATTRLLGQMTTKEALVYIGAAAYFFTASTSFANPAVTLARMFSDTFAGIAPLSVPGFIGAQIVGLAAGWRLVHALSRELKASPAAVPPAAVRSNGPWVVKGSKHR